MSTAQHYATLRGRDNRLWTPPKRICSEPIRAEQPETKTALVGTTERADGKRRTPWLQRPPVCPVISAVASSVPCGYDFAEEIEEDDEDEEEEEEHEEDDDRRIEKTEGWRPAELPSRKRLFTGHGGGGGGGVSGHAHGTDAVTSGIMRDIFSAEPEDDSCGSSVDDEGDDCTQLPRQPRQVTGALRLETTEGQVGTAAVATVVPAVPESLPPADACAVAETATVKQVDAVVDLDPTEEIGRGLAYHVIRATNRRLWQIDELALMLKDYGVAPYVDVKCVPDAVKIGVMLVDDLMVSAKARNVLDIEVRHDQLLRSAHMRIATERFQRSRASEEAAVRSAFRKSIEQRHRELKDVYRSTRERHTLHDFDFDVLECVFAYADSMQ